MEVKRKIEIIKELVRLRTKKVKTKENEKDQTD